jgi:serine phosphatase RsbU (regulator of sigma subunit)
MSSVPWDSGSLLLLYTDGLSEAAEAGEIFGAERITSAARDGAGDAGGLLRTLLDEVGKFTGGRPTEDDITLLAVQGDG